MSIPIAKLMYCNIKLAGQKEHKIVAHYTRPLDHPDVAEWMKEIDKQYREFGQSNYFIKVELLKESSE